MNSIPEFDRADQAVPPTHLPLAVLELGEVLQRREVLRLVWKDLNALEHTENLCLLLKDIEREAYYLDLWIAVCRSTIILRAGR